MYKIMLVDDDYPVLMYLNDSIAWDELGMEVIGMYENGLKAFENAKKCVPDILITDIGMPKMNGLQLIEEVNAINPDLLSLVISCHDDFKYAQKAIRLNVGDYILKETISVDIIVDRLKSYKEKLREKSNQTNISDEELSRLKTQWIKNTMNQEIWDQERWEREAKNIGINMTGRKCIPVMGYISNKLLENKTPDMSESLFGYAMANITSEIIDEWNQCHFLQYSHNQFILLFYYEVRDRKSIRVTINQLLKTIHSSIKLTIPANTSFILGEECNTNSHLYSTLVQLWNSQEQFFYSEKRMIAKDDWITFSDEDIYVYYLEFLDEFRLCVFESESKDLKKIVGNLIQFIRIKRFHPYSVKEFMGKILIELQIKMKYILPTENFRVEESINETLADLRSLKEVEYYVVSFLEKAIFLMEDIFKRSKRKEILNVQRYIISNIDRNISLNEIADQFHLNHSYLSRLFKKETGENFIEYTTRMKLKRAKELLDKTNKPVEEISEIIGYEKRYFYKIFKRETGVTPNEYRTYY